VILQADLVEREGSSSKVEALVTAGIFTQGCEGLAGNFIFVKLPECFDIILKPFPVAGRELEVVSRKLFGLGKDVGCFFDFLLCKHQNVHIIHSYIRRIAKVNMINESTEFLYT